MKRIAALVLLFLICGTAIADTVISSWEEWCPEQDTETLEYVRDLIDNELKSRGKGEAASESRKAMRSKDFNDFSISVMGATIANKNGRKYLIVEYSWKHSKNSPEMFVTLVNVDAYQNGIQLQTVGIADVDSHTVTKVQPNTECTSYEAYALNGSGTVLISISPFLDIGKKQGHMNVMFNVD